MFKFSDKNNKTRKHNSGACCYSKKTHEKEDCRSEVFNVDARKYKGGGGSGALYILHRLCC